MLENKRQEFNSYFKEVINHKSHSKFLLTAPVGLGKTECLRNLHQFTNESAVICFPTHELKQEFINGQTLPNCIATPNPPEALIKVFKQIFMEPSEYIQQRVKNEFPDYYKQLEACIGFKDCHLVTTHEAFLIFPNRFTQSLIIFDEEPQHLWGRFQEESLFGLEELSYLIVSNHLKDNQLINIIKTLQQTIWIQNPFECPESPFIIKKITNPLTKIQRTLLLKVKDKFRYQRKFKNIITLLQFDELIVNYINNTLLAYIPFPFSSDKKYICLSATPKKELFTHYGFKILGVEEIPIQSKIIHIPINTSKVSLANKTNQQKINKIIQEKKIKYIISYKEIYLKNQVYDIFFGNAQGTNKYKDVDGVFGVVGTPMFGLDYFIQLAIQMDIWNLSIHDFLMVNKEIEINNTKIMIKTFQNNWLANQHIQQVYNELVQLIGRLRPYTTSNKTIYLFSKLPILCHE